MGEDIRTANQQSKEEGEVMLEIKNLNLSYEGRGIFSNLSAIFRPGEITVISGASGCGKSSLLKLINGIIPQFEKAEIEGEILFKGKSIRNEDVAERSAYISTVFQNPKNQFYAIDTRDEMAFALENRNLGTEEILACIDKYTELLGTKSLLDRNIFKLSGGEKQMVAITAVSCMEQEIYLFDEPSSSLDRNAVERLRAALKTLKDLGKIIIIAEHRLFYLRELMDALLILRGEDPVILEKTQIKEESIEKYGLRSLREHFVKDLKAKGMEYEKIKAGGNTDTKNELLRCVDFKYPYFSKKRIFDFSIGFVPGVHFIIGENGAGKTSFIRCLCDLNPSFFGKIYYKGKKVGKPSDLISLVMQDVNYQLFTESVWEELSLVSGDDERKKEVLKEFGLWEKREMHPQSLSGGEKQRLAIALCMASDKPVVVLDEPTSGLCRKNMEKTADFIEKMRECKKLIIVISHDFEFISCCKGRILEF